jgi:hypothetical protein
VQEIETSRINPRFQRIDLEVQLLVPAREIDTPRSSTDQDGVITLVVGLQNRKTQILANNLRGSAVQDAVD